MQDRRIHIAALVLGSAGAWGAGCYYSVEDPDPSAGSGGSGNGAGSGGSSACEPACSGDSLCVDGACEKVCSGLVDCNGTCVNTATDADNCGDCAVKCAAAEVCDLGKCKTSCSPGLTACGSSCFDLQIDPLHCGACETACGADQDCVAAACVPSCESQLVAPFVDPWGHVWDGSNRAAAVFDTAEKKCAEIRGRLPLVSEAHRVRKGVPGALPNIVSTYMWTSVPRFADGQWSVNPDWGGVNGALLTDSLEYRCMCPTSEQVGFSAGDCFGPYKNECFAMPSDDPLRFDRVDRPGLNKAGALYECVAVGGQLASPIRLAGAVRLDLPGGSGTSMYVADESSVGESATLTWTGIDQYWNPSSGAIGGWGRTGPRPFRCVGPSDSPGVHPKPVADEFVSRSGRKAEGQDKGAAGFAAALKTCWDAGGHLPTATELAELVIEGLPGGSGAFLQTVDHGSLSDTFGIRWNDVNPRYGFLADIELAPKTSLRPFRCLYYPIDTAIAAPESAECQGGCPEIVQTVSGAKMWIDGADRPSIGAGEAVEACATLGAELASLRDLLEAFYCHKLSTTATTSLRGFDVVEVPVDGGTQLQHLNVKPPGASLDPAAPASFDAVAGGGSRAYRCRWTNEIR